MIAVRYMIASLMLALGFTQYSLGKEGITAKPIHIGMLVGGGRGGGIFFRQIYGKEWWPLETFCWSFYKCQLGIKGVIWIMG